MSAPESEMPGSVGADLRALREILDASIVKEPTDPDKAFKDLQAGYALAGHQLRRSDPADGPPTYYATRWGLVRELPTLSDAVLFLLQIGGRA